MRRILSVFILLFLAVWTIHASSVIRKSRGGSGGSVASSIGVSNLNSDGLTPNCTGCLVIQSTSPNNPNQFSAAQSNNINNVFTVGQTFVDSATINHELVAQSTTYLNGQTNVSTNTLLTYGSATANANQWPDGTIQTSSNVLSLPNLAINTTNDSKALLELVNPFNNVSSGSLRILTGNNSFDNNGITLGRLGGDWRLGIPGTNNAFINGSTPGDAVFFMLSTQSMILANNGNVSFIKINPSNIGIGTMNPDTKFVIFSTAGTTGPQFVISTGTNRLFEITGSSGLFSLPITATNSFTITGTSVSMPTATVNVLQIGGQASIGTSTPIGLLEILNSLGVTATPSMRLRTGNAATLLPVMTWGRSSIDGTFLVPGAAGQGIANSIPGDTLIYTANSNGRFVIGIDVDNANFIVSSGGISNGQIPDSYLLIGGTTPTSGPLVRVSSSVTGGNTVFEVGFSSITSKVPMRLTGGTTSPLLLITTGTTNIMEVNGTSVVINVALDEGTTLIIVPDDVFEPSYNLLPLSSVEKFIHKNEHLPGVPSQDEIHAMGHMDPMQMSMILLRKLEESYLYIEQLDKRLKKLEKKK